MAKAISEKAVLRQKKATIHIKIDTGMSRLGFMPTDEAIDTISKINKLPGIEIEGIFSHLAFSEAPDKIHANMQIDLFSQFKKKFEEVNLKVPIYHIANSAAIIEIEKAHFDMVRPGISIYGYYVDKESKKDQVILQPALSVKAVVSNVKKIPSGMTVGYSCKWQAPRNSVIATLPLGYADGISRLLSPGGYVLIHGKRAPIVGNICMDQLMADVSDIPRVEIGDEVVIIGWQDEEVITVEEVAEKTKTINYELLCKLNGRLPKIYLD